MTIPALTPITLVARELQDTAFVRWPKLTLLDYLNDAQLAVVLVRPDANGVTENLTLTPGSTKHALTGTQLRLLDVHRNMGTGAVPGKRVRMATRNVHESVQRIWHTATPALAVDEVYYDERLPKTFWTNVPAHAVTAVNIEATLSKAPAVLTLPDADNISLDDVYRPALEEWMLYRAYSQNIQATQNRARAAERLKQFYTLLGMKWQADQVSSPNRTENNG